MPAEALFAKNLALLAEKNPGLAQHLKDMPMVNMHLVENHAGMIVGRIWDVNGQQWVPLCDPHHPFEEAVADVDGVPGERDGLYTPNGKVFLLFGMGLGYFAVEFAKRLKPYQRLAIFDASANSFKAAMHAVDMTPILGGCSGKIDTFLGDNLDEMMQHWFLTFNSHEKFHLTSPMRAAYTGVIERELYEALMMRSMDMIRYHGVGLATWRQFGCLIGDNDLANMPEYFLSPGMNAMAGAWEGRPAICVAAGPSLKKNIALLTNPELRKRVCVICVGTMYAAVTGLGIVPDIVTTIDFQRLNWTDQFMNVPLDRRTTLLYLHSTWPTTPRVWPGPKFVALNSSDTTEWMRHYDEEKQSAAHVQTVAHLNVVAAITLKANPIILLGQDLAMPLEEHHAVGARVQDCNVAEAPESHVNADDIYGQPCWTRHSFLSMRTVFQQMFAKNPGPTYLNCTEGGINIDGAQNRRFVDVAREIVQTTPAAPALLYDTLQKIWAGYRPKGRLSDILGELRNLVELSKALQAEAAYVIQLDEERSKAQERDDVLTFKDKTQDIMRREGLFHSAGLGFALYVVRCFEIVENMSDIPPDEKTTTEDFRNEKVYQRVLTVARCITREGGAVDYGLRHCIRRLEDVERHVNGPVAYSAKDIERLIAREHFALARDAIADHGTVPLRLQAKLASRQQEYARAVVLAEMDLKAQAIATRCQKRLDAYWDGIFRFLPTYYRTPQVPLNGELMVEQPAAQEPEPVAVVETVEYPQGDEVLVAYGEEAEGQEREPDNGNQVQSEN